MTEGQSQRRLILYRHAKSAWRDGVEDHDRPLAERGRRDAPRMGRHLREEGLVPGLALVSSALRTQETWELTRPALGHDVPAKIRPEIYEARPDALLDTIRQTPAEVMTLLVIGHNPGLEQLARLVMADDGGEAGRRLRAKFPTAAVAVLDFEAEDWWKLGPKRAALARFVTPKSLG